IISIVVSILSLRLTVGYLGPERYGLWIAVGALVQTLSFTDLGIGNALVNMLAEAHGRDDREAARCHVSTALVTLSTLALIAFGAFLAIESCHDWRRVLNLSFF